MLQLWSSRKKKERFVALSTAKSEPVMTVRSQILNIIVWVREAFDYGVKGTRT